MIFKPLDLSKIILDYEIITKKSVCYTISYFILAFKI